VLDLQGKGIGGFVEQKLVLSCSFKCDRINKRHCYESGHT